MYSPERDEMEQLPEEEKQGSLFDDHQEEIEESDDQLFFKHSKTKIHSKSIDIDQHSKQLPARQGNLETNTAQMQKIWFFMSL